MATVAAASLGIAGAAFLDTFLPRTAVASASTVASASARAPLAAGSDAAPAPVLIQLPAVVSPDGLVSIAQQIARAPMGTAVVEVGRRSTLQVTQGNAGTARDWRQAVGLFRGDVFTVAIEHPGATGTAGTLLFALAAARVAPDGATLTGLPAEVTSLCAERCAPLKSDTTLALKSSGGNVVVLPSQGGGGVPAWLLVLLLVAIAGAAWLARGRLDALRHAIARPGPGPVPGPGPGPKPELARPPAKPSSRPPVLRPAPGSGPVRVPVPGSGVVRTALGPEGYVEMDGLLFRVTWQGPQPAPRRGDVVAVARGADGELVAHDDSATVSAARSGRA
jgi:hypothetical protein